MKTNRLLEFGDFRLDIDGRRLTRAGQSVSLPPKVFDLLVVLLENPGRLMEKTELLELLWPGVFVEESNLSVNISTLRKALGDGSGEARWIETVPKKGYRFAGTVTAIAEVAAREPVPAALPAAASEVRRWRFSIWAVGVLGVLALAVYLLLSPVPSNRPRSLAVLPFVSMTGTETHEYLGLGVADAVITTLTATQVLDVRPTSLVTQYKDPGRDALAVGRALGVDAVVDGRIQMIGERIRVTVQLLRVKDGRQMWASTFDEQFRDIFDLEDRLTMGVLHAFSIKVDKADPSRPPKRVTANSEAYRLYLQGQYLASKRIHAATENAIQSFEQSIAQDPDYPLPHAALAHSLLIRAGEGWGGNLREQAKTHALRAISLDDRLAESQLALGQVLMRADWDWAGAAGAFRRAVELRKDLAFAHASLSTLDTALGKHDEAVQEIRQACSLDPAAATWQADLSWTLSFARRFDEAVSEGQKAVELDAWSYSARRQLSKAYMFTGKHVQALMEITRALEINGSRRRRVLTEVATAQVRAGKFDEAQTSLREVFKEGWTEPLPYYELAVLEAAMAHPEKALEYLEKASAIRITRVIWMQEDPELESLHALPRFRRIVAQLQLPR